MKLKSALFPIFVATIIARLALAQDATTPANRIELFNGKDLSGWTFCMKNDADPVKTWSVTNGLVHCNGSAIGYMRTLKNYGSGTVTVVWRFVKVTPKANNTGVLVYMNAPDAVWPMCVQNQGKSGRQGDLFVMAGAECKEHLAMHANASIPVPYHGGPNEHPIGEWDTNVTICAGSGVKAIINGKSLNEITGCTVTNGFIGIQSEGADFEIREIAFDPRPTN
ncbi:MAG TPA: DUF1080 domain-containing protein [Verrucomicrobiae bacterium]|jgi:hypothetical protein